MKFARRSSSRSGPRSSPRRLLDPSLLLKPPTNAWPTYNGDYSGRRFSTLSQINQSNIKTLNLAWIYRANPAKRPAPKWVAKVQR